MTLSFWIISGLIVGICAFVFKKTVSNDVKNDYRLRDILSHTSEDDIFAKPEKQPKEKEPVPVYGTAEEKEEFSYSKSYSTNSYSTNTHESEPEQLTNAEPEPEQVFYEKINDDACDDYEPTDNIDNEPTDNTTYKDKDYSEDYDDENYTKQFTQDFAPKKTVSKSLLDTVKIFWRGITFTVGMLVTIYAFGGLATQVQTSNDAIVYSLWLLIGVILIK